MSSHVAGGVCIHSPYAPKNVGPISPWLTRLGVVRSGNRLLTTTSRAHSAAHLGLTAISGAMVIIALPLSRSGMAGLPQSRPIENDQSVVRMTPAAPAALARSKRASTCSLPPSQDTWKKVWGLAAITSSMCLEANVLSPIAVPRAAAARATSTSPSGVTAWTPVGEIITGMLMGWPITVVSIDRSALAPITCGFGSSSLNASMLSRSVTPASLPPTRAMYTLLGSFFLARRCASATDSNQGFCRHGLASRILDSRDTVTLLYGCGTGPASGHAGARSALVRTRDTGQIGDSSHRVVGLRG